MKRCFINERLKRGGAYFFRPFPSFFDLGIAGMLFVNLFTDYREKIFFVFYTIFLLAMTFIMKQKRDYHSVPLMLLILSGLAGVFTHSFQIYTQSFSFAYLNFYLLSEGFLYLLFGVIFLMIAVRYSTNLKFLILIAPLVLFPYLKKMISGHDIVYSARHTIVCSVAISFFIYCLLKKRFKAAGAIFACGLAFTLILRKTLLTNFACRPDLWKTLILKIKEHPFIGHGFNQTLSPDNMTYHPYWGWLYNHNDYLALASYLGLFSTIFAVCFILSTLKKIGLSFYFPIFLTLAITPFFQMTIFTPSKAVTYLLIAALCITQTHFKEEAC